MVCYYPSWILIIKQTNFFDWEKDVRTKYEIRLVNSNYKWVDYKSLFFSDFFANKMLYDIDKLFI